MQEEGAAAGFAATGAAAAGLGDGLGEAAGLGEGEAATFGASVGFGAAVGLGGGGGAHAAAMVANSVAAYISFRTALTDMTPLLRVWMLGRSSPASQSWTDGTV